MLLIPRRERLRELLAGPACVRPASTYDPISVRIAESLGYEVGMLGGSIASLAILGAPDLFILTLSELAEQMHRIARASALPVIVDADHGYGNALSVMRTIEELETAGAAGLSIEDTALPPAFGHAAEERLLSIAEGEGKMRAALEARQDKSLVIVGRTSAPGLTGAADAIARCRAYEACGVDAIFIKGVRNRDDLEAICAAIRVPVVLDSAPPGCGDPAFLAGLGIRVALQGHQPIQAAIAAIHATMQALRNGTPPAEIKGLADAALSRKVSRGDAYADWIARFLSPQPPA